MKRLEGKIAIVTGAAKGIGRGAAEALLREGATVYLWNRHDTAEQVAQELQAQGYPARAVQVDVGCREEVRQAVADIIRAHGKIDILFCNAGINHRSRFEDVEEALRDELFRVNVFGVWNTIKEVYPHMLQAGYGRIVCCSSVTGTRVADQGQTTYAMTKAALIGLTKALAYEAGPHGITVNAVLPGWVLTPRVRHVAESTCPENPERVLQDMAAYIPLGRLASPDEIGAVVAFLASDDARYVTGTEIVVDGGSTLPETFNILHVNQSSNI